MEIPNKVLIGIGAGLIVLLVVLAIIAGIKKSSYDAQMVDLQNQLASKDSTIETQKGVFQKLTIQSENLKAMLDSKDEQVKLLNKQLKDKGDELLTATTLIVKLRKDLQSAGNATQNPQDPNKPSLIQVAFDSKGDFLPFQVTGSTIGDCERKAQPTVKMKMVQVRPLKLNVLVTQDKTGAWRTSTTSSEENFQIDIGLAGVNPLILEPKWYEKVGIGLDLGVGTGPGFLAGVGLSYQIQKFELGPKAWVVIDKAGVNPYFGAQLLWHPFKK